MSAITEKRDMFPCKVPLCVFTGFWDGDYVRQLALCEVLCGLRAVLIILVRNASPRGPMCFRCLIFSWICLFCVLRV